MATAVTGTVSDAVGRQLLTTLLALLTHNSSLIDILTKAVSVITPMSSLMMSAAEQRGQMLASLLAALIVAEQQYLPATVVTQLQSLLTMPDLVSALGIIIQQLLVQGGALEAKAAVLEAQAEKDVVSCFGNCFRKTPTPASVVPAPASVIPAPASVAPAPRVVPPLAISGPALTHAKLTHMPH